MSQALLNALKTAITAQSAAQMPARLVVGFSGGLDSSALLYGLVELKTSDSTLANIPIIAIHVHHGLSNNADHWLRHCQQVCHQLDVVFVSERVNLESAKGSLENSARSARYAVFEQHIKSGDALLLAHHENDQVETFMMRLMRGSGLTGLSVMQSVRVFSQGVIIRPWLQYSRETLEEYVAKKNIAFIEDESNTDTTFDRNWWRQDLLPKLFKRYHQANTSILKTISVLQQERQLLADLITPIYDDMTDTDNRFTHSVRLNGQALISKPMSVQIQLVRMWLEAQHAYPLLNGEQINTMIKDVVNARNDAEPIYRWQNHQIRRFDQHLYLLKDAADNQANEQSSIHASQHTIQLNAETAHIEMLSGGQLSISKDQPNGLLEGCYQLQCYEGSLLAKPQKRATKTLKKWFQDYGVPSWLRKNWPVLLLEGQVVCVPGLFICEGYTCDQGLHVAYVSG